MSTPYPQVQRVCELPQRQTTLPVRCKSFALGQLAESHVNELTDCCRTILATFLCKSIDALQEIVIERSVDADGLRHFSCSRYASARSGVMRPVSSSALKPARPSVAGIEPSRTASRITSALRIQATPRDRALLPRARSLAISTPTILAASSTRASTGRS